MGGENSILRDCEWDDEEKTFVNGDWNLRSVTLRDETQATVFQETRRDRKQKDLLTPASNKLKSLRHPCLLRYLASGSSSEGQYLVTEQVTPLALMLPSLSAIEVAAGLYNVLEALAFLHDKVGTAHNNLCLEALYVGGEGCWRLGGLEHSCPFSQATPAFLESCRALRSQECLAPEEKEGNVKMGMDIAHTRDVYSFGILVEQVIEKLDELGDMTKTFTLRIQDECLNVDPRKRPTFASLMQDSLFRNDFLEIVQFLKNITMASEKEKEDFFSSVMTKMLRLPEELVARRLASPLLSRFILLDKTADRCVVPSLLRPYQGPKRPTSIPGEVTPLLHVELFKTHVVPVLLRIFHVRDVHIRLTLLAHFSHYVDVFSTEDLEHSIFPQLLLGLRDCDDRIVAASLRCLADLVPRLGGDVVIGGSRRKFFSEGMPKFDRNIKMEKEEKKNVSSVMGKKILLKDLAAMSNGALKAEEEKQQRQREKERRREEARLKREERKRQRQEQELAERMESREEEVHRETADTQKDQQAHTQPAIIDTPRQSKGFEEHNSQWSEDDEKSQEEWSDWEDADKSPSTGTTEARLPADVEVDEGAISDEIERELALMDEDEKPSSKSSAPSTPTSKTVRFSDSVHTHPSVHVSSESESRSLSSQPEPHSPMPGEHHSTAVDLSSNGEPASADLPRPADRGSQAATQASSAMKLGSKKPKNAGAKSAPAGSQTGGGTGKLGAEFDVKAVEIKKTVSPELDFFADMAPTIRREQGDPLLRMLETAAASASAADAEHQGRGKREEEAKPSPSVSFEVKADAAEPEAGGGWEVGDDDW